MKSVLRTLIATVIVCALTVGMASSPAIASSPFAPSITDREALVSLYQSTNGLNWSKSDSWLTDVPLDDWYGVTTDSSGRVIELDLSQNELRGPIPPELGNLTPLERTVPLRKRTGRFDPAGTGQSYLLDGAVPLRKRAERYDPAGTGQSHLSEGTASFR